MNLSWQGTSDDRMAMTHLVGGNGFCRKGDGSAANWERITGSLASILRISSDWLNRGHQAPIGTLIS